MEYPVEATLTVSAAMRKRLDDLQLHDIELGRTMDMAEWEEKGLETEFFFPKIDWNSPEIKKLKDILKQENPNDYLLKVYGEDCSRSTYGRYINNPFDNAAVHDIAFGKRDNPMEKIVYYLKRYYGEKRTYGMLREALKCVKRREG